MIITVVSESITTMIAKSYLVEQGIRVVVHADRTWSSKTLPEAKLLEERFLVDRDREYLTFKVGTMTMMVKIQDVKVV